MAKLVYLLDGNFLGEFSLDEETVTIGRRANNDLQFDNLAISGHHARITRIEGETILEDLESTNGTLVNGKPVERHILQHGDIIEIGRYRIKFFDEPGAQSAAASKGNAAASASDAPLESTSLSPREPLGTNPDFSLKASAPVSGAAAVDRPDRAPVGEDGQDANTAAAYLEVLNGAGAGKQVALRKVLVTLGRPGVQVAVITRRPQGFFVTHVEGSAYPKVNQHSVGTQARLLANGDILEIAGIRMVFFMTETAAP